MSKGVTFGAAATTATVAVVTPAGTGAGSAATSAAAVVAAEEETQKKQRKEEGNAAQQAQTAGPGKSGLSVTSTAADEDAEQHPDYDDEAEIDMVGSGGGGVVT